MCPGSALRASPACARWHGTWGTALGLAPTPAPPRMRGGQPPAAHWSRVLSPPASEVSAEDAEVGGQPVAASTRARERDSACVCVRARASLSPLSLSLAFCARVCARMCACARTCARACACLCVGRAATAHDTCDATRLLADLARPTRCRAPTTARTSHGVCGAWGRTYPRAQVSGTLRGPPLPPPFASSPDTLTPPYRGARHLAGRRTGRC